MVSTLSPYPSLIFKEFRNYFVFQKLSHILWLPPLLIKPFSCLAEAMYIESLRIQNSGSFLFTKRKCSFFPCVSFICLIYFFVFFFLFLFLWLGLSSHWQGFLQHLDVEIPTHPFPVKYKATSKFSTCGWCWLTLCSWGCVRKVRKQNTLLGKPVPMTN